jgi:hypothetical protein
VPSPLFGTNESSLSSGGFQAAVQARFRPPATPPRIQVETKCEASSSRQTNWSGREDSNLRHSAPKCDAGSPEGIAGRSSASQPRDFVTRVLHGAVHGVPSLARFRREFAAPVLQGSPALGAVRGGREALLVNPYFQRRSHVERRCRIEASHASTLPGPRWLADARPGRSRAWVPEHLKHFETMMAGIAASLGGSNK